MEHDFNNPEYCETLEHLFKPGSGVRPPAFTGRDQEQSLLNSYLRTLKGSTDSDGQLLSAIPHDVVLYGPRGNGKTVLLEQFERGCEGHNVDVVSLHPQSLTSPQHLARQLLYGDDETMVSFLKSVKPDAVSLGIPGLVNLDWKTLSIDKQDRIRVDRLKELLRARCRISPLIITVDEAHALKPEVGALLLNTSQWLRKKGIRCLTVFAGTPNLLRALNKMNATFWGRSKKLAIGRLDETATIEALAEPLGALSVKFDENALNRVAKDTQNYPYFVQLWGKALCDALVENKEGYTITSDVVDQANLAVKFERDDYYQGRYKELKKQKLVLAAEAVGRVFETKDVAHEETLLKALCHTLDSEESVCEEQLEELFDLGYVWQSGSDNFYEPGIPSLMTYVQEQARIKETISKDGVSRD